MGDIGPLRGHNPPIWAFSDSTPTVLYPRITFWHTRGVRTFQTIPLAERRWQAWINDSDVSLYIFDLPSIEEVEDLV